ncbi:uncharacterized protein LOC121732930 [Aricia agestis]|uniref:uncharacterized protein LOC121732930 n=1 Tax=Aricia agestis TaxID=91739 RepID=UPI001C20A9D5|nr:uncharacterized protein LOC121732930 [Aricia agestis]
MTIVNPAKHYYEPVAIYPKITNDKYHELAEENAQLLRKTDIENKSNKCERYNKPNFNNPSETGSHSNKNIDSDQSQMYTTSKEYESEKNHFAKYSEKGECVNKFSYSAAKINLITKRDSQIRIVNKLEIDLKVTQIVCKESYSKDKVSQDKEELESNSKLKKYDNIFTDSEPIDNTCQYDDLVDARAVKQLTHTPNFEIECKKSLTTRLPSLEVQNDDKNTTKKDNRSFKNIIEKFKNKARNDTQQKHFLPNLNKTITPIVKSQKQYRIKDINNTDDGTMKNISEIFSEGKHDSNKHAATKLPSTTVSLHNITYSGNHRCGNTELNQSSDSVMNKNNTITSPNLDAIINTDIKLKLDTNTRPFNQNFTEVKYNTVTENYKNEDVFDALKYPNITIDPDSPLEPEDIISVLTESESEELNLSMLNPKTVLQNLNEDEVILPPPMEFCDEAYSPVANINPKNSENSYTPNSSPHDIGYSEAITSNVETWTLSQGSDDSYDTSTNKFIPQNNLSMFRNQNFYSPCSQMNLSQFKYEGKPKLRK